jgi:predicted MFS family arabinose efflux permease
MMQGTRGLAAMIGAAPRAAAQPDVMRPDGDARPSAVLRRNALIGLIAFLTVVDLFATQAILPTLASAYAVSPAAMGVAVNASTFGMALAGLALAAFSRRIGRRAGIAASLALLSVPTALLAIAPDLSLFTALRIVQGLLMAAGFTLMLAYLAERLPVATAASAFAAYITGNVASNLFGRLMAAGLAQHVGIAGTFTTFALLNLAGALLVMASLEGGRPIAAAGSRRSAIAAWREHLANPALCASFGIGFCILFAFIGTFTYVNFVLVGAPFRLSPMALGFVYLVFAPSIVTTPMAGRLRDRFGTRPVFWGALAMAALGLPLIVGSNLPVLLVGLALVGIGTFLAQAMATAFVGRAATGDRGAASGLYLAAYFLGGLIGSAVLGQVFDRLGWPATVGGIALALGLAAALAGLLASKSS